LQTGCWGARSTWTVGVVVAVVASFTVATHDAASAQEDSGGDGGGATIELAVDVASASSTELVGTIEELAANVQTQIQALDAAEAAVAAADQEVAAADAAVEATELQIAELVQQSDAVVVQAFVAPPSFEAIDALTSPDAVDSAVKQTLLDIQADADAHVLTQLQDAREQREQQRQTQREARATAAEKRSDAEDALSDVQDASSQQVEFLEEVQDRLDQQLSEAAGLEDLDPETAAQLQAEQESLLAALQAIEENEALQRAQELLAQAAAEAAAAAAHEAPELGPASGSLGEASCPGGGSITVDSSLVGNLQRLLDTAANDGVSMCGGGYRSSDEQIALREAHCGSSYYAIYEMPASDCSPPTAKPGASQHEVGLAIDFTTGGGTIGCGSAAYDWLSTYAENYGLYVLSSECWHWSTTGN
jgi:LAS superfamily LD-carboxypeptidase LdcB